ncbi:MAG: hypothetical protein AAGH60_04485 [Pseudomonadota bacterium]
MKFTQTLDGNLRGFGPGLAPFHLADPFHLSEHLNEHERLITESTRAFATDKLMPRIEAAYAAETVDLEIFSGRPN